MKDLLLARHDFLLKEKKSEVQMHYVSDTRPKTAFVRELRDNHTTTKERYKKELFLTERPFKDLFKALTRPLKKLSKTFKRLL